MRRYCYVGPIELRDLSPAEDAVEVNSLAVPRTWLAEQESRDRGAPFTYVVTTQLTLLVAPRRREHIACTRGEDVLGAGEIQFDPDGCVTEVSNQSTSYCPDLDSWPAVAAALDRAGLRHPDRFTQPTVFRACWTCFAINIVRDDDFECAVCGESLPDPWNLDQF